MFLRIDRKLRAFVITTFLFILIFIFPVFATPYIFVSEYPEEVYEGENFVVKFVLKVPNNEILMNFENNVAKICLLPGEICSSSVKVEFKSPEGYGYGYGYSPNFGGEGFIGYGYGYGYLYGFVGETEIIIEATFKISNPGEYSFNKVKLYFSNGQILTLALKNIISIKVKEKVSVGGHISETRRLPLEKVIERKLESEEIKEITNVVPIKEIRDVKVEKKEEIETIAKEIKEEIKEKIEEVIKKEIKKEVKVTLKPIKVKREVSLIKITTKEHKSKYFIKVREFVEKPVIINFPKNVVQKATDIIWIKGKVKIIENDPIVEAYPENKTIEYLIEGNNTEVVKEIESYEYNLKEVKKEEEIIKPKPEEKKKEIAKNETITKNETVGGKEGKVKPQEEINIGLLILAIVTIAIIGGIAYYLFRKEK